MLYLYFLSPLPYALCLLKTKDKSKKTKDVISVLPRPFALRSLLIKEKEFTMNDQV